MDNTDILIEILGLERNEVPETLEEEVLRLREEVCALRKELETIHKKGFAPKGYWLGKIYGCNPCREVNLNQREYSLGSAVNNYYISGQLMNFIQDDDIVVSEPQMSRRGQPVITEQEYNREIVPDGQD